MPVATCRCGKVTNSTTSNYWDTPKRKPTKCYAAFVNGKWVKGCAFSKLRKGSFARAFANSVINGSQIAL